MPDSLFTLTVQPDGELLISFGHAFTGDDVPTLIAASRAVRAVLRPEADLATVTALGGRR